MPIITYAINAGVGAFTGAAVAFVGYLSNSSTDGFKFSKAMPTFVIGLLAGAISGFISPNPEAAVIAALSGDVLRNAAKNYVRGEKNTDSGPA